MDTGKKDQKIRTEPEQCQAEKDSGLKKTMSVPEMRKLIGLKKTDSYWLVHRNFFKTEMINGRMRVDIESFEKWYANQVKHKKVTGEAPGEELLKKSYSAHDVANLLGIHDSNVYEFVKKENLETVMVDYVMRIPIEVFEKWYDNQIMYQKVDKLPTITDLEADYIRLSEEAELLGITREKLSMITRASRFKDCFEVRVYENKKWISKKSFQHFLNAQNVYQVTGKSVRKVSEKRSTYGNKGVYFQSRGGSTCRSNNGDDHKMAAVREIFMCRSRQSSADPPE